ncbi:hypothetical protein QPK13_22680 [Photorhabdus tasmaniensis]
MVHEYLYVKVASLAALPHKCPTLFYALHTESIKTNIIPALELNPKARNFAYANEADILNLALFGKTASDWRKENPELKGNIRDYATLEQLVVLLTRRKFISDILYE